MKNELIGVRQAAILLKVHPSTIRRYCREGKLKGFKVGNKIMITLANLIEYVKNNSDFKNKENDST